MSLICCSTRPCLVNQLVVFRQDRVGLVLLIVFPAAEKSLDPDDANGFCGVWQSHNTEATAGLERIPPNEPAFAQPHPHRQFHTDPGPLNEAELFLIRRLSTILFNVTQVRNAIQAQSPSGSASGLPTVDSIPSNQFNDIIYHVTDFLRLFDDESSGRITATPDSDTIETHPGMTISAIYLVLMIVPLVLDIYNVLLKSQMNEKERNVSIQEEKIRLNSAGTSTSASSTLVSLRLGTILRLTSMEFHVVQSQKLCRMIRTPEDEVQRVIQQCDDTLAKLRAELSNQKSELEAE